MAGYQNYFCLFPYHTFYSCKNSIYESFVIIQFMKMMFIMYTNILFLRTYKQLDVSAKQEYSKKITVVLS